MKPTSASFIALYVLVLAFAVFLLSRPASIVSFVATEKNAALSVITDAQTDTAHQNANTSDESLRKVSLSFGDTVVKVDIADTYELHVRGLSGRGSLAEDEGMLFIYSEDGYYSFWMPDMLFPIDIIWLDANYKVVFVKKNATPESYPETFSPSGPSRYVLEVPSGFAERHGVSAGTVAFVHSGD